MYPNLKLQLWKRGIRQNRLAKELNVDETTLSRIVNGFREPSPDLKRRISAFLDCDVSWLFQSQDRDENSAASHEIPTTESA